MNRSQIHKLIFTIISTIILFFTGISSLSTQTLFSNSTDSTLVITLYQTPVLTYHHAIKHAPLGIDSLYQRSGFLHPIKTLRGHTITEIQPEDHYHHYGLWNAWTHVEYAGDTLDFWNLAKGQGTVRFAGFKEINEQSSSVEFSVKQEHIAIRSGYEEKVLKETVSVEVTPGNKKYYILDFEFRFECAQNIPFKILEYRYAGFCWRTIQEWYQRNSRVLTSRGFARDLADGSLADWFMIQGELEKDWGGAILMSHPTNFNHPQPLRIWPAKKGEHSKIMAMFAPTKNRDWILHPGVTYGLRYRMIVFDGKMKKRRADKLWNSYIK